MLQKGGMLKSVIAARLPNKIETVRRVLDVIRLQRYSVWLMIFQRTRREEIKVV